MSLAMHLFAAMCFVGAMCSISFGATAPIAVKIVCLLLALVCTSGGIEAMEDSR